MLSARAQKKEMKTRNASNRFSHALYCLIEAKQFDKFKEHLPIENTVSNNVLLTQYYIAIDDEEHVLSMLLQFFKKRQLRLTIEYLISKGKVEFAWELHKKHMPKFEVEGADVQLFLGTCVQSQVFDSVIGKQIQVDLPSNTKDVSELKLVPFESDKLISFARTLQTTGIVVDGANVLYFPTQEITVESYVFLDKILDKLRKTFETITLVLNHKYVNGTVRKWDKITLIQTPRGKDDDLFTLNYALITGSKILSNDEFKNHVIDRDFKRWVDDNVIKYNHHTFFQKKISDCVQRIGSQFYVPSVDGGWVVV